jgi:tetratricopeptide (TPR) repeat protein
MTETTETTETLTDSESPKHPFELGLELYEQKAPYEQSIALFEQGVTLAPRDSVGYTCLAWLHILRGEGEDNGKGMLYAQKAVRLDPANVQAHFNLVLGMLVGGVTGVRQEFQRAMGKLRTVEEQQEVLTNLQDALDRRPELESARKLMTWIQGA